MKQKMWQALITLSFSLSLLLLVSCTPNPTTESNSIKSTSFATPTAIPTPPAITPDDIEQEYNVIIIGCFASSDLTQESKIANYIITARVVKIGDLIWNTPDGKSPKIKRGEQIDWANYMPMQLAPVELEVTASYKGNIKTGAKLNLLVTGAPNSKPYATDPGFPKVGENKMWFLANEIDYGRGKTSKPLLSLTRRAVYNLRSDGKWVSPIDHTITFSLEQLQYHIQNPAPDLPMPTREVFVDPTPRVRIAQTINLVQSYKLDKTASIFLKKGSKIELDNDYKNQRKTETIYDITRVQAIVASLNRNLSAIENTTLGDDQDKIAIVTFAANGEMIEFEYNLTKGYLIADKDSFDSGSFRVSVSLDFAKALGL